MSCRYSCGPDPPCRNGTPPHVYMTCLLLQMWHGWGVSYALHSTMMHLPSCQIRTFGQKLGNLGKNVGKNFSGIARNYVRF